MSKPFRLLIPALLFGALLPPPLAAQSATQREALDAFRDSLLAVQDPIPLQQLEAALMRASKQRPNDPLLHLRQGFLSLRLGDLGLLRHYDDAAAEFQWAVDLQPTWPYGWFALGLAEYELGEAQGPGSRRTTMLGRNASTRAATAWMRAAQQDPGFAARLEVLAAQAVRRRDADRAAVVLDALRQALASQPPGRRAPAILLALGRVEREVGDLPAALNALETYRRLGDNRSLGLLEVARTRFLLGHLEGTEAYYEGAAMDDLVAIAAYRADLEVIAPDTILTRFDMSRGRNRAELLASFWLARDRLEFRPPGSRLREHYQRLAWARRSFSAGGWTLPSDPDFLRNEAALDDRGRLYVRHGEPDARATLNALGVEPNESWHYRRPGGDMVFHFVARQDPERFRLVESLLDVVDQSEGPRNGERVTDGEWQAPAGVSDQLLRSRAGLGTVYAELGPGRPERRSGSIARERALVQTSLQVGLSSDSYEPRFGRDLAARLHAVSARGPSGATTAHLLVAVPGFGLQPVQGPDGFRYPMRLRFVAIDGAGQVRAELDTLLQPTAATLIRPERYLEAVVSVPVPAGVELVYRMGLFVGEQDGSVSALDTLHPLPEASPDLRLGDLILGNATSRASVGAFRVLPMQSTSRSERLQVRADVTGVAGDGRWRAVFRLRDPVTGEVVHTREFGGRVQGGRGVVQGAVSLGRVSPGRYLAELEVTDPARGVAVRHRRLGVTVP
jgi:GWxTD domain-containing protein